MIEFDENNPWAWTNRGDVLNNLERYEEALVSYRSAIELDANNKFAWFLRGLLLNDLERYEEALVSVPIGRSNLMPIISLLGGGEVYLLNNLKRYEEALSMVTDRALKLNANDQWAWVNRGNVLDDLKRYERR